MYSDPCRQLQGRRSLLLLADVSPHLLPVCVVCLILGMCPFAVVFVVLIEVGLLLGVFVQIQTRRSYFQPLT